MKLDLSVERAGTAVLSATRIQMLMKCPKQFEYRYVLGIKTPPSVAMEEGGAHHHALFTNNAYKIKKGEDLSTKKVVEAFCDDFSDRAKHIKKTVWEKEETDSNEVIDRGKLLQTAYMSEMAPSIVPLKAEYQWSDAVGDVTLAGHIDLIEADPLDESGKIITEYKTAARTWSDIQVEQNFQLATYAVREGTPLISVINLVKTKVPKVVRISAHINVTKAERDVRDAVGRWDAVVKAGLFPPCDPTMWWCSEKWCGYWRRCRGKTVRKRGHRDGNG